MPRVNAAESFLWRAAPQPGRTRLLGALAIALSCGALGVLAGRWSVERVPSEPGTRTAALIEAVAKETQAKLAVAAHAPHVQAAPPTGALAAIAPVEAIAPVAPGAPASRRANSAVTPEPRHEPAAPEAAAGEATPRSRSEHAEQQPPPALTPAARELRRPQPRREPHETSAPDYRALRDYVLSR
jgi:hypothetical protein